MAHLALKPRRCAVFDFTPDHLHPFFWVLFIPVGILKPVDLSYKFLLIHRSPLQKRIITSPCGGLLVVIRPLKNFVGRIRTEKKVNRSSPSPVVRSGTEFR